MDESEEVISVMNFWKKIEDINLANVIDKVYVK
jgi:hypothetical protein